MEGFDFNETFAPIVKMTSVRCFLIVATAKEWDLHLMDIENTFLHGDLEGEVYIHDFIPGFHSSNSNKVFKLQNPLYGLKLTPGQ